jgi:hypothetical protein
MKPTTLRSSLWIVAACAAGVNVQAATEHSSSRQTLHFAGKGERTLEVRTITGTIIVEASDGPDVEMIVNKTLSADTEEELRAADSEVTLETADNEATVGAVVRQRGQGVCGQESPNWSWHSWHPHYEARFDFIIRVPRAVHLELCTINKGDVSVKGTNGRFEIRSVNGSITMTDVGGAGEAYTVNGPINASFAMAPAAASELKTVNGEVVVAMPDRLDADLRMKTFNGGLYTDFEVQAVPPKAVPAVEKHGAMSVYRTNGFTTVRVGNGGPELTLDTLNGDVRVVRRSR